MLSTVTYTAIKHAVLLYCLAGVGHFPQDKVPNLIGAMLDAFRAGMHHTAAVACRPSSLTLLFSMWCCCAHLAGVGHFPQDEVPNLIGAMLDAFVEECAVDAAADEAAAAAGEPGSCRVGGEQRVEGFTLRGLMAAAEMDSKV
jgi:hypothetical protein